VKVILIDEDRFNDLTDRLLIREQDSNNVPHGRPEGCSTQVWKAALDSARREMHFEFVRWAQSHGATCVRRM
jgi:hypothetical protein